MGVGKFDKPEQGPKGPTTGKTVDYDDLPESKKDELGALDALRVPTPEPELAGDEAAKAQEGAERLDALRATLAAEEAAKAADPMTQLVRLAEPTDGEKRAFLRSLFANSQYKKVYSVFDGALTLTMIDTTPDVEAALFEEVNALYEDKEPTEEDWNITVERARLTANVDSITMHGTPLELAEDAATSLITRAEARISNFNSTAMYRAALQTVRVFMLHLEMLVDRALDSDFWTAAGHDQPSEPTSAAPSDTQSDQS